VRGGRPPKEPLRVSGANQGTNHKCFLGTKLGEKGEQIMDSQEKHGNTGANAPQGRKEASRTTGGVSTSENNGHVGGNSGEGGRRERGRRAERPEKGSPVDEAKEGKFG